MAKSLMIQGTASGVGKTILVMALCRIFKQDGYRVSPFKPQNMTSNTAVTKKGELIALSQLLQALSAGAEPDAAMNPVILTSSPKEQGTKVILNGHYYDTVNAYNFGEIKTKLKPEIMKSYTALSRDFDIVVIEGAGSPVELNLNKDDIVNMGMAKRADAPVLLVSDIDRGGIFASLYGTVALLDESERPHVKATIVNRFKGDLSHFRGEGTAILERITGVPVAGVVPHIQFDIPEEDLIYNAGAPAYEPGMDLNGQFDIIADCVRKSLDMELVYRILNEGCDVIPPITGQTLTRLSSKKLKNG